MPEKFIKDAKFALPAPTVENVSFEKYACPNCRYWIPVRNEHTDYRMLYNEQTKIYRQTMKDFNNLLMEIQEEIPEAKIFFHNRKAKLQIMCKELLDFFETTEE